jgi:hypothetical protein
LRGVAILLASGLLALAVPAAATVITMGGFDVTSQYTYTGSTPTSGPGMLTFGSNSERGWISTEDILGSNCATGLLCMGAVTLDLLLDQSGGFNVVTGKANQATFVGAGAGPDFAIYEAGDNTTVALGFEVNFIDVTQVQTDNPPVIPGGTIVLGTSVVNAISSRLVLTSGSLNALIGLGSEAWLHVRLPGLSPALTARGGTGYLANNFASGIAAPGPDTVWDLVIVPIPEPTTAVLLGLGLLAMVATARRTARR